MKNVLLLLASLAALSACTNTRDGIQKDSARLADKMQAISQTLQEP